MERLSVDTSLKLWQTLYDLSIFITEPDVATRKRELAWKEIDFILDFLIENKEFMWQEALNGTE